MTCIVGVTGRDGILIGGDTLASDEFIMASRNDEKVFRVGEFLFGCSYSFRVAQVIRYGLDIPAHPDGVPDHGYLATLFMNEVRRSLRAAGAMKKDAEMDEVDLGMLIAYRGTLYDVGSDLAIGIPRTGYSAIGSGGAVALGALHATSKVKDPKKRVIAALEAAQEHAPGVRKPWTILRAQQF